MDSLPIDPFIPVVVARLRIGGNLVVVAPPGTGKTTRIPRGLLDAGFAHRGEIVVLEPRRLATRLAATRVAEELDEEVGRTVGYTIRFESRSSAETRIRFVTEGVLTRRIAADPELRGVGTVILDEFHERHLATELAFSFLRLLQKTSRPDLHVVVMSATIDPEPIASFLDHCPTLSIDAPGHPVAVEFRERSADRPLEEMVTAAVGRLLRERIDGDVLVFLPGAAEIRRALEALEPLAHRHDLHLVPLHGDLPVSAQAAAIRPTSRRKIILSTNVAESSVTVPGVVAVVDSGLERTAGHSFWTGLPTLSVTKTSRASATQRAGRAGRTRPGRVLRLYTKPDFDMRPAQQAPEIRRSDLSEIALTLHAAGIRDLRGFHWFERPQDASLEAAEQLLHRLGAITADGDLTPIGSRMLAFPLHPRLARVVVEGERTRVGDQAALVAAILSERDLRLARRTPVTVGSTRSRGAFHHASESDVLELLQLYRRYESGKGTGLDVDRRTADAVGKAWKSMRGSLLPDCGQEPPGPEQDQLLRMALLAGFPDRVAIRRDPRTRDLLLCEGGSATLSAESAVHHAPLLVAIDAEERDTTVPGTTPRVVVRVASAVEPEWLVVLFSEEVRDETELIWNESALRVDVSARTVYGRLRLDERLRPAEPSHEVAQVLAQKAIAREFRDFADADTLPQFRSRVALAASHFPAAGLPTLADSEVSAAVAAVCAECRSLKDLAAISLRKALEARLDLRQRQLLEREVPEMVSIPGGRRLRVHYEAGQPPWVESRLQDFFTLTDTPAICVGRVPLTLRLLAPNHRPVQVTRDLKGFWERHYPGIRRQLQRQYPKHSWPAPEEVLARRRGRG